MDSSRKIFLAVAAAAVLAVAALLLWPRAAERLAPELVRAWVAVEVGKEGVATVGQVEIPAGSPFTLHAVLEATRRGGRTLYYTEARRLVVAGQEVPATSLQRWDRPRQPKLRWFTVEGSVPYLKASTPGDLARFRFADFLRSDWPETWAVPGRIEPANDDELAPDPAAEAISFGTQRYSVWIELYAEGGSLIPEQRFAAPGAKELAEAPERVTAVAAVAPRGAAAASRFFGLSHLDLDVDLRLQQLAWLQQLTVRHLAYDEVVLLSEVVAAAGGEAEDLAWRRVDLGAEKLAWGSDVQAGDLIQAGARWVVLYRDSGEAGVLDHQDLCFDFARAPTVRPLSQVFLGGGELDLARLGSPRPGEKQQKKSAA